MARVLERARDYSFRKYTLSILDTFFLLVLLILFLSLGLSRSLAEAVLAICKNKTLSVPVYFAVICLFYFLIDLPLNFYRTYTLEHKFSLSKQTIKDWVLDQLKSGLLGYFIGIIILGAFYLTLKNFPGSWWIIISVFWVFFNIVLAKLTPTIIIPLFFKYKRLTDSSLRERIMKLAKKMEVALLDCFEINFSKKTLKANAAFVGVGRSRRVILADTLKDKYSHDEIEVILAHEFAHYKLKHLMKLVIINSSVTLLLFYIIFKTSNFWLSLFGIPSLLSIAALPLLFVYFILFSLIVQPVENYISRKFEFDADAAALEATGLKNAFISMMEKLAIQNLADRRPHPLVKFFFFDHPPIDERIALAKRRRK